MDKLTFYFDRNFGKRLPEALWRADPPFLVEYHHSPKNRFPPETPDDEWLEIVGAKGWFAFSHDRKWHEEKPSLLAIKQYSIGCFYLWGAESPTWDKLCFFVNHWAKIMQIARNTPRPFVHNVNKEGRIEKLNLADVKAEVLGTKRAGKRFGKAAWRMRCQADEAAVKAKLAATARSPADTPSPQRPLTHPAAP